MIPIASILIAKGVAPGVMISLILGGCNCGMSIEEENAMGKKTAKKRGGCCDMQIVKETDDKSAADNKEGK